jgi:hypothetical protein
VTGVYKFGYLNASGSEVPFQYANCWAVEKTTGPSRLVIASAGRYVELMMRLTVAMREPFGLLYVLLVPRAGEGESGRYQSPAPVNSAELEAFLWHYQDLLEKDARQHLWIMSVGGSSLLVYDNHNVIYAYGPLAEFENVLRSNGLTQSETVSFPVPHVHKYNAECDQQARDLMDHWKWIRFPLQSSDDP